MTDKEKKNIHIAENDETKEVLKGPSNLQGAVANLMNQIGNTSSSISEAAARELAIAVSVADDIRDTTIQKEALKESRDIGLIRNVRNTTHNMVDLGFDVAAVSVRTIGRSLRLFLNANRQR